MGDDGWTFDTDFPGTTGDRLKARRFLREVYVDADPTASGRVTVPILWDKQRDTIVSNESAEIIRMFNSAFDGITGNTLDFWPEDLRAQIEEVNARIYRGLNNGVYRAGFATEQSAYVEAATEVFDTLDWLETRLATNRYLMGPRLTEADWRLVTTLFRFDPVYHGHFKCNRRRLADYLTSGPMRVSFIKCPAWPGRSIFPRSPRIIMPATRRSTRPASCPSAPISTGPPRTTAHICPRPERPGATGGFPAPPRPDDPDVAERRGIEIAQPRAPPPPRHPAQEAPA